MNNSVFGMSLENIRYRADIKLCSNESQKEKLIAKPNFESRIIFEETLAANCMKKAKIIFNTPTYLGMSILDI
jgi:hypothetical protein